MRKVHYNIIYAVKDRMGSCVVVLDTTYRFWRKADWIKNTDGLFNLNEDSGHVSVLQDGVYLIYAQVQIHSVADITRH